MIEPGSIAAILLAMATMAVGSAAQASIGMGLNLFAVPILALIDPVYVPGAVLVHSFILSCIASYRLRTDIDSGELAISVGGLIAGTLVALVILTQVSTEHLPRLFGAIVVAAVLVTAAGVKVKINPRRLLAAGAVAGLMGAIAGMHGPPMALLYQRETPARIRSALLPFFAFANPISLAGLIVIGLFGWRELYASLLILPGLAAGYLVSPWLIRIMRPELVRACLLSFSAISGLALVIKG
jgi:uncharacterized membrane protein YfcA